MEQTKQRLREAARRESAELSKQYDREQREFTKKMEEARRLARREELERKRAEKLGTPTESLVKKSRNKSSTTRSVRVSRKKKNPRTANTHNQSRVVASPKTRKTKQPSRAKQQKKPSAASRLKSGAMKSTILRSNLHRDFPSESSLLLLHVQSGGFLTDNIISVCQKVWKLAQWYMMWLDNGDNDMPVERSVRENVTRLANSTPRCTIEHEAWTGMQMMTTNMSRFEISLAIRCASLNLGLGHISGGAAGDNYQELIAIRDHNIHCAELVDEDTTQPTPLM